MSAVFKEPLNKQIDVVTLRRKYESHLAHLTCENRHERKSMISTRIVASIRASNPQELQWILCVIFGHQQMHSGLKAGVQEG